MAGSDLVTEHLRTASLTLDRVSLEVLDGPRRGFSLDLPIGVARIGKSSACHLALPDRAVSRIHCEIRVNRSGVRVVDCRSTNGTFVEGVLVYEAELRHGSHIRLGETTLRVSIGSSKAVVPLAPLDHFGQLIGASPEMRAIYALIPAIASSEATTLIQGETGTGKELLARAIHSESPRASRPFVVLDCAGLSPGVIESDLFGHARGAFTGAVRDRAGLFEAADGGTIFIDEIADLPIHLQPRLLRVLEAREIRRMGENRTVNVDVHVIAASSKSLAQCVNERNFREDLLYRLAVAEILLPPLRDRGDDVLQLASHFWTRFAGEDKSVPEQLLSVARSRSWPGNVRELRNFVERVAKLGLHLADSATATSAARDVGVRSDLPLKEARRLWNERFDDLYAEAMLARTGGNVTRAAELAEVTRRSFQRLLAKNSEPPNERDESDDA